MLGQTFGMLVLQDLRGFDSEPIGEDGGDGGGRRDRGFAPEDDDELETTVYNGYGVLFTR